MLPETDTSSLPLRRDIQSGLALTVLLAVLMGGLSLAGLILPAQLYPTAALIQAYWTNDLINLLLGLPILLGSLWLIRRQAWFGLLCWPGAVLYVLYNAVAYLVGLPFGLVPALYGVIVLLCAYLLFLFLTSVDPRVIQHALEGKVSENLAGWVLAVFGVLFILRAVGSLAGQVTGGVDIGLPDLGVLIADVILSSAFIWGGAGLIRRRASGYATGLGLLFAGSMLFIGLIAVLLLQPLLTSTPTALIDALVVLGMGMVCFIPCGLFARGVFRRRETDLAS